MSENQFISYNYCGNEDFSVDEVGDIEVNRLKTNAHKRKGRGFDCNFVSNCEIYNYESAKLSQQKPLRSFFFKNFPSESAIPIPSIEGWVLFVTGIHEEASESDIHDKFSEIAPIKSIRLNLDRRTGFLKNYAIVEYQSFLAASKTKEALNNTELLGMNVKVDWCFISK